MQSFRSNLEAQLEEIQVLQSMYQEENEFTINSPGLLLQLEDLIENEFSITKSSISGTLSVTIHLHLEEKHADSASRIDIDVECNFPHSYPSSSTCSIFVRSKHFSRQSQSDVNAQMKSFLDSCCLGEQVVFSALQWVTENYQNFIQAEPESAPVIETIVNRTLRRDFLWFHHIYSKKKKIATYNNATALHLTGRVFFGKPGIIVVEGPESDVISYTSGLRRLPWQKMVLKFKHLEHYSKSIQDVEKFDKFERIYADSSNHSRLDILAKTLQEAQLDYCYRELVGLDPKDNRNLVKTSDSPTTKEHSLSEPANRERKGNKINSKVS